MSKNNWLANKELRKQVIWWTIGVGFFLIPLLYAVIANDFSAKLQSALEAGLEISGFAVIGIFISGVVVYNFKIQALDDVRDNNIDIENSFINLQNKKSAIKQQQIPIAMDYINRINDEGQATANETLTQTTITQLKNKLVVAQIKGKHKKIESILAKIENLENNAVFDKKFKPLKYKDVLKNNNGIFSGETSYRKRYVDNPTAINWWFKIITTPLKFLTLAGSLLSGMVLGISWEALFLFYLSVTITTAISSLITYILVSNRIVNKTYGANINMIDYIDIMMIEISKVKEIPISDKEEPPLDEVDKVWQIEKESV
jgi:hypothetical protein